MCKIKKAFCYIMTYFVAFIFHFFPRDKHLWLTGKPSAWYAGFTSPDFFDNAKYFYLYLVNKTSEKVYWVSSSKNEIDLLRKYKLPYIKYGSLRSFFYVLRAKYFFHHYGTDQINPILQAGAVQIDFWHGTPLKKIRYDVEPKTTTRKNPLMRFLRSGEVEYVSSTSEYLSQAIIARAFGVPLTCCLNFGYPRTDILKLSKEATLAFCHKYTQELIPYIHMTKYFKKIFLYMPTWRDDDPDYFSKLHIDFTHLNEVLKTKNWGFFLKLHPLTKFSPVAHCSNIFQIKNDVDIYPFLTFTNFLVTDYSSIYFDYLLLDKEIIFIPYDFEHYTKNRELYFNYDEITPGLHFSHFNDFITMIDSEDFEKIDFSTARALVRDKLIKNYDFTASEKTYRYFSEEYGNEIMTGERK